MKWSCFLRNLPVLFLLLILQLIDESKQVHRHNDRWEHITIRYGIWRRLPPYQPKAFEEGYRRVNNVCKTDNYHGFLFIKDDNRKAMPIYDLDGNLAGIQSAIPGNMKGYDSNNRTIHLPPEEIMPPVLKGERGDRNGILYYTVTAYFKHPKLICSPIASKGVSPGRGLYIQMGYKPENDFLKIALEARHLDPLLWRKDNCIPQMGTHYFKNMSKDLPCEKLHPLFLMYDAEGKLGAFGWVFQGRPQNFISEDGMRWFHLTPEKYPFLYDTSRLPPCMMYEKFQVFGIHIYFKNYTEMLCTAPKDMKQKTTVPAQIYHTETPPVIDASPDEKPNMKNIQTDGFNISSSKGLHYNCLKTSLSQIILLWCAITVLRGFPL